MAESDVPTISDIENDVFTDPWPGRVFLEDIDSVFSYPFVAQLDGEIAGYAILWIGVDEGHLTNIAVARKYQRKSIAQTLLSFILRFALEHKLAHIILEVRPSNEAAIALYRKFGFTDLTTRRKYYTNPPEDCLMMIKTLTGDADLEIGD